MEAAGQALLRFDRMKIHQVEELSIRTAEHRPVVVTWKEYWNWLDQDDLDAPDYPVKALLRDYNHVPLTREEKRARRQR